MRRNDKEMTAGFGNTVQFVYKAQDVWDVFDHMPADNFVEFIVLKWIREVTKIVNDVSVRSRITIDAHRVRKFILTTTNIEDLFIESC